MVGGEALIDIGAAEKVMHEAGWDKKEADAYIEHEMGRTPENPYIEDYEHPANAEHDMNRRYTKIAVQRAKELAENPIVQTAIKGGAIKLSKDTQHLFEMLDIADDIIDKQLIMEGNYSPIIDSIDSYLGVYSYN